MARNVFSDCLQDHTFWLMDVAPVEPLALPVFLPLLGFSAISAPEMTLETTDITEGNSLWRRKVVKRADISPITLSRGSRFYDADFYRWTMATLRGSTAGYGLGSTGIASIGGPTPRRDLVLIQYFRRFPLPGVTAAATQATIGQAAAVALVATSAAAAAASGGAGFGAGAAGAVAAGAIAAISVSPLGPWELYPRVPARAWLLRGCLPTRYKAGSDFDATSGQVSSMELDVAIEALEEISLAA